jgi:hypothetical protein
MIFQNTDVMILNIEHYMDSRKQEIVDFAERKISEKRLKDVKITGDIFDRLVNQLSKDMPFRPRYDMTHIVLANALISSLWCGWLSQAMINKRDQSFSSEYLGQFKRAITKAFEIGQKYASERR